MNWENRTVGILKWTALGISWTFQYMLWIPMVLVWWLAKGAVKFGVLGLVLVLIPVLGWIILAWLIFRHKPESVAKRSIWKPWGIR